MNHRFARIAGLLFISILFCLTAEYSHAQHGNETQEVHASDAHDNDDKDFDPGYFITNHVVDSHEWHVADYGDVHITAPLPVILFSKYSGFHLFSSGKFKHGHSAYKGFFLESDGDNKGKIVEYINGKQVQEWLPDFSRDDFVDMLDNLSDQEYVNQNREALIHDFETNNFAEINGLIEGRTFYYVPLDFSITKNVVGLWVSIAVILWIFLTVAKGYKTRAGKSPKGVQSFLEPLIIFLRDEIAKPAIGEKKYERFMPFLLTLFFFIFINNLMGLIPIPPFGANVTGNIAVTLVLAFFTFAITSISGNRNYWKHIVNTPGVPWWLKIPIPLMPIVEIAGMFIKPVVLMVRLFANIMAGHIIVLGFFSLIFIFGAINVYAGYGVSIVSIAFTVFMTFLELLVAFIQAFVFTLLSAIYFGMAVEEHHEGAH